METDGARTKHFKILIFGFIFELHKDPSAKEKAQASSLWEISSEKASSLGKAYGDAVIFSLACDVAQLVDLGPDPHLDPPPYPDDAYGALFLPRLSFLAWSRALVQPRIADLHSQRERAQKEVDKSLRERSPEAPDAS